MDRFWDYLGKSVIVQGAVTTGVVGTMCYMFLAGREVPKELTGMAMLILGFWFGTKTQHSLETRVRESSQ